MLVVLFIPNPTFILAPRRVMMTSVSVSEPVIGYPSDTGYYSGVYKSVVLTTPNQRVERRDTTRTHAHTDSRQ